MAARYGRSQGRGKSGRTAKPTPKGVKTVKPSRYPSKPGTGAGKAQPKPTGAKADRRTPSTQQD